MKLRHNQSLLDFIGAALLLLALAFSWLASLRQGQDFGVLYAVAVGIVEGAPIYDPAWQKIAFAEWRLPPVKNVPYPPSAGFSVWPIAVFPFQVAQFLWFLLLATAVVLGVGWTLRLSQPEIKRGVWLTIAAAVLMSSCVRWGITPLQSAPLVVGLLACLVAGLHTGRPSMVFLIVTFTTALKFTIAFPFFGLMVLHRRYWTIIGSIAVVGLLNLLGFVRVGGMAAIMNYRSGLEGHEAFGTVDSPDPWDPFSVPRLDWPYLFNGLSGHLQASRLLAVIVFVAVCFWLFKKSQQLRRPIDLDVTVAFLVPLVCLSMLCVYHHHYDISPLLVPLLFMSARHGNGRPVQYRWELYLMAPLVGMMALLPIALSQSVATNLFGAFGQGLFNISFPVATTLMLVGSLIIVHRVVDNRAWEGRP